MANDAAAADAQERRPAIFSHVKPLAEAPQRRHEEQSAELCHNTCSANLLLNQSKDRFGQPFGKFKHNISNKAVTDNYIKISLRYVPAFRIPDKVNIRLRLQELIRFLRLLVPLQVVQPHESDAE